MSVAEGGNSRMLLADRGQENEGTNQSNKRKQD